MLAAIHLSEEEKFNVLLAAFALFLSALFVALCLAITLCPLNKWLLERDEKRRRRLQELAARRHRSFAHSHQITSQQSYYTNYHSHHFHHKSSAQQAASNSKCAPPLANYIGPPPAYEAALRATRLQSLTGNSLVPPPPPPPQLVVDSPAKENADSPDWLKTVLTNHSDEPINERPLDLGDYFHSPKEPFFASPDVAKLQQRQQHLAIPMHQSSWPSPGGAKPAKPRAPVMLRLWVKLLEPDELVERAREQTAGARQARLANDRPRLSLSRQLSIPQLFGSLMTLAGAAKSPAAAPTAAICDSDQHAKEAEPQHAPSQPGHESASVEQKQQQQQQQQPNSLSSSTSGSSSTSAGGPAGDELKQVRKRQPAAAAELLAAEAGQLHAADETLVATMRRRNSMPAIRAITSRVLHMNVASFSYVKDESLISTKKHNQLNFHHFYAPLSKQVDSRPSSPPASKTSANKVCQLLVSICDIENLLGSSCLEERACLKLAQNSSIYVKCEILAPKSSSLTKSTASRLLRNPLKVLTHQESVVSNGTHTIDFGPTIPATVMEPVARATSPTRNERQRPPADQQSCIEPTEMDSDQDPRSLASVSSASDDADVTQQQQRRQQQQQADSQAPHVNWRHEPAADGKSILMFNSIPKQVAQQQQLAFSSMGAPQTATTTNSSSIASTAHSLDTACSAASHRTIDLVQFDSVFVSPILNKSLLESGHIRLRVYAQCKYVNETCLAELKLPLRQLMRAQSKDNLGDARGAAGQSQTAPSASVPQQQADFILNNLLANLVTASTGSPLSTLIEQISAEEREAAAEDERAGVMAQHQRQLNDDQAVASGSIGDHFRLANWLGSGSRPGNPCDSSAPPVQDGTQLHRCSSSPGTSRLDWSASAAETEGPSCESALGQDNDDDETRDALERLHAEENCNRLIEQNHCRSLMVSHWLNYLVAPSYECQLVQEQRGKLVLGLTYLPTSNRLVFNAHRASVEPNSNLLSCDHKQLVKRLRLQSDTSYLLRFMMVVNDRVVKRKQTASARKPEWDSQEPVTFDLVNVNVEQPSFVVALVMRNPHSLAAASSSLGGSLQSLANYHQLRPCGGADDIDRTAESGADERTKARSSREPLAACQSDPESLRLRYNGGGCDIWRPGSDMPHGQASLKPAKAKRDLVVGHLVLADELWHELKAQPRKQLVKQFRLL